MASEPKRKRVVAFFDGQNVFHRMKSAFGATYPDYDPKAMAQAICALNPDWDLVQTRFYTGLHSEDESHFWHYYWASKCQSMAHDGVAVHTRPLRYQRKAVTGRDGKPVMACIGVEKGIDVRIALDCVRMAVEGSVDVILLFSQDQDLAEVVQEVRNVSRATNRWIKLASAYPVEGTRRGVVNTDWFPFDKNFYEATRDLKDHRPRQVVSLVTAPATTTSAE